MIENVIETDEELRKYVTLYVYDGIALDMSIIHQEGDGKYPLRP